MEEALTNLLLTAPSVIAALDDRINWGVKPQSVSEYPYCVLQVISGDVDYAMRAPSGLKTTRVQFDVYGEEYLPTRDGARAVATVLSGYRGTVLGITFKGIFQDGQRDLPAADAGEVTNLFRKSLDFIIWHN